MQRKSCGRIGLGRGRDRGCAVSARATRREPGSEAIEPIAEGVDGDAAELAELDVGQSRAVKIGEDSRPVDFAGRLSHGGASRDSGTGPILTSLRRALKMRFTGRTPSKIMALAIPRSWKQRSGRQSHPLPPSAPRR